MELQWNLIFHTYSVSVKEMMMHALRFDCLLRYCIVATLVRMLLLDTTMNFKLDSNSLITRKVWVGFGRNLHIFRKLSFLHLSSISYKIQSIFQRASTMFAPYGQFKDVIGRGILVGRKGHVKSM